MKLVALFTCASIDIGGWCTVKHRYLGYHVACPPWLMYWSKRGSLFSIDLIFMAGSWVCVSWRKNIRILLCSNAWYVPVSESGAIQAISFYGRLGRCCLFVVSFSLNSS